MCVSGGYVSNYIVIIIRGITIQHNVYVVCLLSTYRNFCDVLSDVLWSNPHTPTIYIHSSDIITVTF